MTRGHFLETLLLSIGVLVSAVAVANPVVKLEKSPPNSETEWVLKIDKQVFSVESIGGTPKITKIQNGQLASNLQWLWIEYDCGTAGTRSIVDLDRLTSFVRPDKASVWIQRFDVPIRIQRSKAGSENLTWNRNVSFSDRTLRVDMDEFDEFSPVSLVLSDLKAPQIFQWMQRWTEEGGL